MRGFTLLELILVVGLIGMMLLLAVPRFQASLGSDRNARDIGWIMANVQALKHRAVMDRKAYALNVNLDTDSVWLTHERMSETEQLEAARHRHRLGGGLSIRDVEFASRGKISSGGAAILFYKDNTCDHVLIHLEDADLRPLTVRLEPFLPQAKLTAAYANFED